MVFARNFVRLYALELQLEPDALFSRLPRVDIEAAPLPDPPGGTGRNPWDPRITAALASVLWLVTAGGAGTGAWYYYNHYGRHLISTVSAAPAPKTWHRSGDAAIRDPAPGISRFTASRRFR